MKAEDIHIVCANNVANVYIQLAGQNNEQDSETVT